MLKPTHPNETIQNKDSEIIELKKEVKNEKLKCAAEMGEKVGEGVAKVLLRIQKAKSHAMGSGGGTRRRKKKNDKSKRRTKNRRQ